jgi:hypothetical protein
MYSLAILYGKALFGHILILLISVVSEEDEDQKRKRVADEIGQGGSPKRARIEV